MCLMSHLQVKRPSGRKRLKRAEDQPKEQDAEEMRHELFGSEGVLSVCVA